MKRVNVILAFFLCVFVFSSQTTEAQNVPAPDLQCVVNDALNSNVDLVWSIPSVSCGSFNKYLIYGANSFNGPYSLIDSVKIQGQTTYTHVGALSIDPTWFYYLVSDFDCPGANFLHSDTIENEIPVTPVIKYVTVENGKAKVVWETSPSKQTAYYIASYFIPPSFAFELDTVYGIDSTLYIDKVGNPNEQSLIFTLAASDSCGQISPHSLLPHQTMHLTALLDRCTQSITMDWNRYINWPQGVQEYQAWLGINGDPPQIVAVMDSGMRTLVYSGFSDFDTLCFFIKAVSAADNTVESNSNEICLVAEIVQPPNDLYMRNVSYTFDEKIASFWLTDSIAELIDYKIQRSKNNIDFLDIDQYKVPAPLLYLESYLDTPDLPIKSPFTYQIVAIDSCFTEHISTQATTMFLDGSQISFFENQLEWSAFEINNGVVNEYNIYRNEGFSYSKIANVNSSTLTFVDDVTDLQNSEGVLCYRIEALFDLDLPNGFSETNTTFSNEYCVSQRPIIYIPSAFAPEGVNFEFKPSLLFGDLNSYSMRIYNRWGEEIFATEDIETGWRGTSEGKKVPSGGYAYYISFRSVDNVTVERTGMITLIR